METFTENAWDVMERLHWIRLKSKYKRPAISCVIFTKKVSLKTNVLSGNDNLRSWSFFERRLQIHDDQQYIQ